MYDFSAAPVNMNARGFEAPPSEAHRPDEPISVRGARERHTCGEPGGSRTDLANDRQTAGFTAADVQPISEIKILLRCDDSRPARGHSGVGIRRIHATSLYGLSRLKVIFADPTPFLYSAAIVSAVAFVASFPLAWRAALLSPVVAIQNEAESVWRASRLKVR